MTIVRKIVYELLSLLNIVIPKKKRVFIYGGNELSGNSEAMFRYLINTGSINVMCVTNEKVLAYEKYKNAVFVNDSFFHAMWAYLTSQVVLDSSLHKVKIKPTKKQLSLQLWHGSPLKHLPKCGGIRYGAYYTYVVYASDLFKEEMKQSFGIDDNRLLLLGNPRNDDLFKHVSLPSQLSSSGKAVMWMPTFRRGIGLQEASRDIPILSKDNIPELETFLKRNRIKLFIKPHPLQMGGLKDMFSDYELSFIHLVTDNDLRKHGITLYEMLGSMDALLTDYSSVFFDYLLIDRPIGFAIDDIEEYSQKRGFALSPPESYMPGAIIQTYQDLLRFFNNVNDEIDMFKKERKKINQLVNYYQDDRSAERCTKYIMKALNLEQQGDVQ